MFCSFNRRSQGFSLVEVLVAALILFMVLTAVTVTYTGAVKSSLSAVESINLNVYSPMIAEDISVRVKAGQRNGEGRLLNIKYEWRTDLLESAEIAKFYDSAEFTIKTSQKQVFLWEVTLETTFNNRSQSQTFKAISWSE